MKKIFVGLLALSLIACSETEQKQEESNQTEEQKEVMEEKKSLIDPRSYGGEKSEGQIEMEQGLAKGNFEDAETGYWVGMFEENMINLMIYEVENGDAKGFSVCAGNYRPITGTFQLLGDGLVEFDMAEPGDDQWDGKFVFRIDTQKEELTGNWTQFSDGKVKEYTLHKRSYTYDPTLGKYPEASQRKLDYTDVENLSEDELAEMRNEIYARHGYSFKNKDWRRHFEATEWYIPVGIDVRDRLTDTEVENIELIYEYESYYEEYYDDYGR